MSSNGSTWPGTLPTLRKIFRIPTPPHPSFGRFKPSVRRRELRSAHSPPPLATPEGNLNLSRRPSSVFSRRAVTNYGGPSTDINDLGFWYDTNKSLPFLDVATASADRPSSADEYNAYQNYDSTSSAPPPLSALTSPDLKDLPSSTSVGSSEMDVALQHSFLGAGALLYASNPNAPTSQAGPSAHSSLSDLQPPDALGPQSADYSEGSVVLPPSCPRIKCVPLPPASLSPRREHQSEMVPGTVAIPQSITSDYFKPRKLVVDWEISLIDMRSILSALRHCLQDLTIGPIGVGQPTLPSPTPTIYLSHLKSLKVDQVDFSFLKELLASVRMDSLRALGLHVGSPEGIPHELNLGWGGLTDVVLHDDFFPETLDNLMKSLRDVTRLKWLGNLKLAKASCNKYTHRLDFLNDVSICSNKPGCSFFIRSLQSTSVENLHLSHFPRRCEGHGFSAIKNLSIEHEISVDQFLATLRHFPTLLNADFEIGGSPVTEQSGMQQKFASLVSLTLRRVSAPIWSLLMPIPLSELESLTIMFDLKETKHRFCLGLSECLQKEKLQLSNLCLVDANITVEELKSILEIVGPTLVDYQVRETRLRGDIQLLH